MLVDVGTGVSVDCPALVGGAVGVFVAGAGPGGAVSVAGAALGEVVTGVSVAGPMGVEVATAVSVAPTGTVEVAVGVSVAGTAVDVGVDVGVSVATAVADGVSVATPQIAGVRLLRQLS